MFGTKTNHFDPNKLFGKFIYLLTGLGWAIGAISSCSLTAIAQTAAPAGTIITNQVTGSFGISGDTTGASIPVESNIVSVSVSEVAGIAIVGTSITEAPSNVAGGGTYQGLGGINQGDIVYFDFAIANTGNDPTQFTISTSNVIVTGGALAGNIQIIGYNPSGVGNDTLLPTPISVSGTVDTGGVGGIGLPNGSVPVGGSIKIRVPVKVSATAIAGDRLAVQLTATTKDNPDYTITNNVPISEATGTPSNGEQTGSASQAIFIVNSLPVVGYESVRVSSNRPNAVPGDQVIWTISYVNVSALDIANFQITDLLPTQVTKFNSPTVAIGGNQILLPKVNASYNGTTNLNLFDNSATPFTLRAGGTVTLNITTTVNPGVSATISNQAQATGTGLATVVLTDDIGSTSDLPLSLTSPPYNLTVPTSSVPQTQQATIDPTILPIASAPKLLLVKRITAINNQGINPNDSTK